MKKLIQIILLLVLSANSAFSQTEPKLVLPIGHTNTINSAQFSPDGKYIVTASYETVKVWESISGKLLYTIECNTDAVNLVKFSPDGKKLITGPDKLGILKLWDINGGKLIADLSEHTPFVNSAQFSPDGKKVVVGTCDYTAILLETESGKLYYTLNGHTDHVNFAQFSPDGTRIVTVSEDKTAKLWNASNGKLLRTLKGHSNGITLAAFSPDGLRVVTASEDNTAKIWDPSKGKLLHSLVGHTNYVSSANFISNGQKLVTTSNDNTVKVWDVSSGKLLHNIEVNSDEDNSVTFSSDWQLMTSKTLDGTVQVRDLNSGKLLHILKEHPDEVRSATFSQDGRWLVTTSFDEIKVWDLSKGKPLCILKRESELFDSGTFSPDGQMIVTVSGKTAQVWNVSTGLLQYNLEGLTFYDFESARFSPDGQKVFCTSSNKTYVWDVSLGKLLYRLDDHKNDNTSSTFSSKDNNRVVTASEDKTALQLDASGELIKEIPINGNCMDVNFENNTLISYNNSKLTLWNMETGKEIYSWLILGENDYLVMHPDGFYDGTRAIRRSLYFVCNDKIVDLVKAKNALYVPYLVEKIMSGQNISCPKLSDLDLCTELLLNEDNNYNNNFQTQPRLILPIGHTEGFNSANFSPDGKRAVTASDDKTAKVWDVESGKLIYTLYGHIEQVNNAHFSPNGKLIVTASDDKTAKVWDSDTGIPLYTLNGHEDPINFVQFSPDGKLIITVSDDRTTKVWDSETGKLWLTFGWGIISSQFSPDGTKIVSIFDDGIAKIWDPNTGAIIQTFKEKESIKFIQYSPDGKRIVIGSGSAEEVPFLESLKIYDLETSKLIHTFEDFSGCIRSILYSPNGERIMSAFDDGTLKVWNAQSGILLLSLHGHSKNINFAQFSNDGKKILTVSSDNTTKIWDSENGVLLQTLETHDRFLISARFSSDGRKILTNFEEYIAQIWDSETGKLLHKLEGHTQIVQSARLSPDNKKIVIAYGSNTAKIWDLETGSFLFNLDGHTSTVNCAEFSPDGESIVTVSNDGTAKLWNAITGKIMHTFIGHKSYVDLVQYSPDGKMILTADSFSGNAKVWDSETVKLIHSLDVDSLPRLWYEPYPYKPAILSANFSPDSKRVVINYTDNTVRVWDVETGKLFFCYDTYVDFAQCNVDGTRMVTLDVDDFDNDNIKIWDLEADSIKYKFEGEFVYFDWAQFSPDGKMLVTASIDKSVVIWDLESNKVFYLDWHTDRVNFAQFSPDGKTLVTSTFDRVLNIWDTKTGYLIKDIQLSGLVEHINFEENTILTHNNSLLTLWEMETGKEIYSFLAVDSTDYLVMHPDGYYDGTEGAREYLYFTCGTEIIDLAQMKDALYVPGLVEKIMNGQDINYPKLSELEICGALPLVEQVEKSDGSYHYRITPRRLPLEYTEVYVNGKMVLNIPNDKLKKEGDGYILTLAAPEVTKHFVARQSNQVKVVGIVKQNGNILRSRGAVMAFDKVAETTVRPSLYALMVGVNDYKDPQLQLRFPAKDSRDLGNALELSASKLLGSDRVFMYHVNSEVKGTNGFSTPEREGIRRALEDIGRKAKPEDVVLIFMAGHGVMQGDNEKAFTFLTAEASNYNKIGITTKDLQNWLSYEGPHRMLANKSILIFDACNSGQATQELLALARSDDDTRRIRQVEDLKDKSGMFILAASAPNQSAYELPQYEQGLLTYSLLHTLKNNPDVLDDSRFLNIQKWFLESEKYLQQLVKSLGYDQDAQPFGTANIRIGEVDETVKSSIKLAAQKPIVICANVLNTLTFSDDLQLKGLINQSLADISERGVDNPIFFARQETPNANSINILYQVDGEIVTCQVRLVKGSDQLHQAVVNGTKTDLNALVNKIVDEVVRYAK